MAQKDLLSMTSWNTEYSYTDSKSFSNFEVDLQDKEVERNAKGTAKSSKNTAVGSNTVADTIINAFIVKRRKALIDQEEFKICRSSQHSYETSEKRLIALIL